MRPNPQETAHLVTFGHFLSIGIEKTVAKKTPGPFV